ncbi:MAG: Glutamine--fructose-6-phosphate transaminase (isomerizing) [Gaiellaceae bacterium]|nr:Glutamine--fructose-6-phosphate transaminase (isomerizing) [Gaiellaceae bacterium]
MCSSRDVLVSSAEPVAAIAPEPGARFREEIREQPHALLRLLERESEFARVGAEMRARGAATIRMVGHGSSDNAASYGVYAFGLLPGWTALRDSISLTVYYGAQLDMSGCTALALSQSGRTPDVVEYARRAKSRGAYVVAITNDPSSELADVADAVLELRAGPELAVAATKTYTNQLAALGLLAAHTTADGAVFGDEVRAVAAAMPQLILSLESRIANVALPFAYAGRMFVVGRGAEFATAREIALKLLETCRIAAEPLTATDLAHGPIAAIDSLFPVWAIASDDATLPAVVEAVERAREAGATVVASGNAADAIPGADYVLPSPPASPLLAPLLSILPGQLFAGALARARGLDPDTPRGLSKVTLAR